MSYSSDHVWSWSLNDNISTWDSISNRDIIEMSSKPRPQTRRCVAFLNLLSQFLQKIFAYSRPFYWSPFFLSLHFMDLLASRILYITEALRLLPTTSMVLDLISFNNLNQSTLLKLKTILMLSEKAWIGTKVADYIVWANCHPFRGEVIYFWSSKLCLWLTHTE